jgi:hypothetical protein
MSSSSPTEVRDNYEIRIFSIPTVLPMYMVVTGVKVMWQHCGRVSGCDPNFLSQVMMNYIDRYSYFKISYVSLMRVHLHSSTHCFIRDVYGAATYHSNAIYPSFSTGLQRM